jgi:hypothetical protein
MARFGKGILDSFSGTVGPVVGSSWKGIDYMRSKPKKRKGKRKGTEKQTEHRKRFAFGIKFLNTMKDLFDVSFKRYGNEMTSTNNALSHFLSTAVTGVSPNLQIDYTQVLVSKGSLPTAKTPAVTAGAGKLTFTWADNSGTGKGKDTDKALLVAFCEELDQCLFVLGPATRNTLSATLDVAEFSGKEVQTWLAFIAADDKDAAPGLYTGTVTVL